MICIPCGHEFSTLERAPMSEETKRLEVERQISDEVCLAAMRGWNGWAPDADLSNVQTAPETTAAWRRAISAALIALGDEQSAPAGPTERDVEALGYIQRKLDAADDCPDHPTGRMVDALGNRVCASCGRSSAPEQSAPNSTDTVLLNPPPSVLALVKDMAGCELCWDADEEVLRRVLRKCAEAAGIVVEQSAKPSIMDVESDVAD